MSSKYAIETVFKLIDNITAPLDKIGVKSKTVGRALKNDFVAAQDSVGKFGSNLKKIGGYAVAAGIAAVGAGLAVATKQFIEYDQAITAASAKFKDLDVTSATYQDSLKEIGKAARDVAAVTEYNAVDTAGALDKMAMAGLTSKQSMAMLMGTTNLATAAGLDLTTAVDIATDTLGAFRLMTDSAGNALDEAGIAQNMDRVSDVFARATNQFNTDMPGLFEAIKKGGPVFSDAGQSIETFSALMGVMANSGIKGGEAGTQLRNIMLQLANPTDKAGKLIDSLGVKTKDSQGNYLDIIDIIGQFEKATQNMGSAERAAAMSTIFGTRAVTGMNILMAEGVDKLNEYRTGLEDAGGAAANIANAMRNSIKNKIEVLKSALTELGFKFVETFQEKGVGFIERLTDAVSNFDPKPIIDAMVTTANIIMKVIGIIWELRSFILGVAIAWGIYKAAMIAAVIIGPIIGMIKAVQALMAAQKGMNVVQAIFNVLMNANPIGLIVTGIGILIGLFILAYQKCEPFRNAVNGILEKLKALGAHIVQVLSPAFEKIKSVFEKVGAVIGAIVGTVGRLISMFFNLFNIIVQGSGVLGFLDAVLNIVSGTIQFVLTLLGGVVDTIGAIFTGINDVIDAFSNGGILAGIKQIGLSILNYMLTPIKAVLDALSIIPGIGGLAKGASEKIGAFQESLRYNKDEPEAGKNSPEQAARSPVVQSVPPAVSRPAAPAGDY